MTVSLRGKRMKIKIITFLELEGKWDKERTKQY